jgi:hypothetical protein
MLMHMDHEQINTCAVVMALQIANPVVVAKVERLIGMRA